MYPRLIALDTDWTIFRGWLDQKTWGKGQGASSTIEDNIQAVDEWVLRDKSNHNHTITLGRDVPKIVTDILKNGAKLAIVSRNTSKALALWYFKATDPKTGKKKPIIHMAKFDEVYNKSKTVHFTQIHGWTKYDYSDMLSTHKLVCRSCSMTKPLITLSR
ncbi:hypothetical protein PAXRUDRAFT_407756 [Paxillus rubicundulus Ve08.2h10]|uniref:Uncharacterized protein n=1 Tax=Paxillus rubicundulus Ve08.2h10 TaxID=930991 RepID=A0A0D0DCW2_9AGAM|nr:hypothetical protein PAXRUDRAFT_407756 [Paxillus rubicundulus Ve08.2h10]